MHYIYLDEAGCTLRALVDPEQPIFVLGGLAVNDKSWNRTLVDYENVINDYFENQIPNNFELHTCDLLSPNGEGYFENHERGRRNQLARDLMNIIPNRRHRTFLLAIDKGVLNGANTDDIRNKDHVELKTPYLLSYDNAITMVQEFIKSSSRTARGMFIIDEKDGIKSEIQNLTKFRRFHPTRSKRVKRIVEFTYAIDSHQNPMIQLADLVCFVSKKYLGIENGFHDNYPVVAKEFFRELYSTIDDRLFRRTFVNEQGRYGPLFNTFMSNVQSRPRRGWRNRDY